MCWIGFGVERNKPGDQSDLRLHLLRIDGKDCKTFWFEAVEPSIPEEEYRGMFTQHGYATHTLVFQRQEDLCVLWQVRCCSF